MSVNLALHCSVCNRTPATLRLNDHNFCAPCAHALIDQASLSTRVAKSPEQLAVERAERAEMEVVRVLREYGPQCRTDAAVRCRASRMDVSEAVRRMLADGRLEERCVVTTDPVTARMSHRTLIELVGTSVSMFARPEVDAAPVHATDAHANA